MRSWLSVACSSLLHAPLLILTTLASLAQAQDSPSLLTGYTLTAWSRTSGLQPGNIWALAEDAAGYLWLGADFGLVRFDGTRFMTAESLGLAPLPDSGIQSLLALRDGTLWIGFAKGGISRVRGHTVTTYVSIDGRPLENVTAIVEQQAGGVLAVADGQLFRFEGERWTISTLASGRPARTVHRGRTGDLLMVIDRGIVVRRHNRDTLDELTRTAGTEDALPRSGVTSQALAQDARDRIWSIDPVFGFRLVAGPEHGARQVQRGKGNSLLTDRRGNLWVGTFGQGLWRVPADPAQAPGRVEVVSDQTGLSNSSALSLLEDHNGNIWVGTAHGLNRLTPHKFNHVSGLGLVMGIESTADGSLWAGTADGVVQLIPEDDDVRPARRYLRGSATRTLHAAPDGTVWVATDGGIYSISAGEPRRIPVEGHALRNVSAITSDGHGGIWLFDDTRGLFRWRDGRLEPGLLPDDVRGAPIGALFTGRSGTAWLCFDQNRLVAIDAGGHQQSFGPREGVDIGGCRAIYQSASGTVWVIGTRGIGRYDNDQFTTLRSGDALLATLTSVIDGDDGSLWFGSAWGLVRMHPREFDLAVAGRWADATYDLFDVSDGVSGTTRWTGLRNAARTPDGRLWFLTVHGVTIVDPPTLRSAPTTPSIALDDIVVDGRRISASPLARLPPGSRRVEINFNVPDLASAAKTRLRYRLRGFDTDWVDAGPRRQAVYTNLPPRSYVFDVQASNPAGSWIDSHATWTFAVAPAFYQTGWFYGVSVMALMAGVAAVWQLRLRTLRQNFALLLGERVRLSREIHDTLLQSLVGVSLQLDQLGHELETSPNGREQVVGIRRQVDEYIRDARQSIWNLRSSRLENTDLVSALRRTGGRAVDKAMSFHFTVTGTPQRHPPAVEEQLLRIGQEAVANAAQHSAARRVAMELHYGEKAVTLRVTDDGRGFDAAAALHTGRSAADVIGHWGLLTMEERAAGIGGQFTVSSTPGNGTIVDVSVPLERAGVNERTVR